MASEETKSCFVIAPIGEENSEIRRRSDQIFKYVIEPVAKACGYEAVRADRIPETGLITSQITQHIINSSLVIADLTGNNPNVFYELAIRHAHRKPYVQIIQKDERIPFDVAGIRTIQVDHHDLDSVEKAKSEIADCIKSMEGREDIESPISIAVDYEVLRQKGTSEQKQLVALMVEIENLKAEISSIAQMVRGLAQSASIQREELLALVQGLVPRAAIGDQPARGMAWMEGPSYPVFRGRADVVGPPYQAGERQEGMPPSHPPGNA